MTSDATPSPPVTLVHLVSASYDAEPVRRFVSAYLTVPAGIPHRLVVLMSGFDVADGREHAAALDEVAHEVMPVPRSVIDLQSYITAARRLDSGTLCFLNSNSEPLAEGWLALLTEASRQPGVGMVGATGSWESHARGPLSRWPRFPNIHLRTNAFMIDRDLMVSLRWPATTTKEEAWRLESGRAGVTRQVCSRGLEVRVVGRDGVHAPPDWAASRTFRSGEQENLLVADNRTRDWATADSAERMKLSRLAWGTPGHG